jgi:hypothetical protein
VLRHLELLTLTPILARAQLTVTIYTCLCGTSPSESACRRLQHEHPGGGGAWQHAQQG